MLFQKILFCKCPTVPFCKLLVQINNVQIVLLETLFAIRCLSIFCKKGCFGQLVLETVTTTYFANCPSERLFVVVQDNLFWIVRKNANSQHTAVWCKGLSELSCAILESLNILCNLWSKIIFLRKSGLHIDIVVESMWWKVAVLNEMLGQPLR